MLWNLGVGGIYNFCAGTWPYRMTVWVRNGGRRMASSVNQLQSFLEHMRSPSVVQMRTYVIERWILFPALANAGSLSMVTTIGNYGDPTRMKTVTFSLRDLFPTVVWQNVTCTSLDVALLVSTVIYSKSVHTRLNLTSAVSLESINYWIERRLRLQTLLWSCSINNTFRSIIKSSLLNLSCRLSTIVQLGKPRFA